MCFRAIKLSCMNYMNTLTARLTNLYNYYTNKYTNKVNATNIEILGQENIISNSSVQTRYSLALPDDGKEDRKMLPLATITLIKRKMKQKKAAGEAKRLSQTGIHRLTYEIRKDHHEPTLRHNQHHPASYNQLTNIKQIEKDRFFERRGSMDIQELSYAPEVVDKNPKLTDVKNTIENKLMSLTEELTEEPDNLQSDKEEKVGGDKEKMLSFKDGPVYSEKKLMPATSNMLKKRQVQEKRK
ncbi:hypothetical protein SNEBB_005204 [Seison nebaliae]|nr:hypothetical protein SNEBB_005204 [Seison nebaliae]